jgi:hypothetical protein
MSFTSRLTEDQLVEDDLLRSAPGIYQQMVHKAFELRITIMGRCVLAAQIASQDTQDGKLDWRRAPEEIKARPFDLPAGVADLCLQLMSKLGIVFGCFDFIVTPDGEYIFLEVNEAGQFLFLEQETGLPLLDRFSDFLLCGQPDFAGTGDRVGIRYSDVLPQVKSKINSATAGHRPLPDSFSNEDLKLP